jgi:hypothetical protein
MENTNQKIIFEVPEDTNPAKIISDILEKNGVIDSINDIDYTERIQRLIFINNSSKDYFSEKISESILQSSIQSQLKISENTAKNIVKDIKETLLIFAKKIPTAEKVITKEKPITAQPTRLINENENIDDNKKPIKTKKRETKTIEPSAFEEPKEIIPKIIQKRGPDSYREPIE